MQERQGTHQNIKDSERELPLLMKQNQEQGKCVVSMSDPRIHRALRSCLRIERKQEAALELEIRQGLWGRPNSLGKNGSVRGGGPRNRGNAL